MERIRGQATYWRWTAPIAAMAVLSIAIAISHPLFSLLLERAGHSGTVIGLSHMSAALAMVIAALMLPKILARTGIVTLMLSSIGLLALTMAVIPVSDSVWWYGLLRLAMGFTVTALFFSSEFWLISIVPSAIRGRVVGIYALILSASYMAGPKLLNLLGIDGPAIYVAVTAIILLGAVPIYAGRRDAPADTAGEARAPLALLRFFRTDPMVLWGVVLFGVIEFGAMGLIAVWGIRTGYSQTLSVDLVFWLAFGSMAFQLPVGWAADRFDRRMLLAMAGIAATAAPLVIVAYADSFTIVAAAIVVWGGMAVGFYTIALTELGARYSGAALADANAAVVFAYGLGALVSPALFGLAMDVIPPDGLLWTAMAAALGYCVLAAVRIGAAPRNTP